MSLKTGVRFVFWIGDNYALHAQYNLPDGRTVGIDTVENEGYSVPWTPDYREWVDSVEKEKRCRYCWEIIVGHSGCSHQNRRMV